MKPSKDPKLSFKLNDGRRITVDSFSWGRRRTETKKIQDNGNIREVVIERKRVLTVYLTSSPISERAWYSGKHEMFLLDYVDPPTLESVLERGLHDLDWEEYAQDVHEMTDEVWKEIEILIEREKKL